MMRVAILDDYQGVALNLADWKSLQPEVQVEAIPEHIADTDTLAKRLHGFEAVILMRERTPLPRALIEKLPNLKLVITTGPQNASVDAKALAERGIVFCGTAGIGAPTAELAWGLMIGLLRHIPQEDRAIRQGRWQTKIGYSAEGKTLGIIGVGKLGKAMVGYAKAFNMPVIGWSRSFNDEKAAELGIKSVTKEELFKQADIVTIHVNLNEQSRGMVGAAELGLMKPTSYLINTSRGPIVDETALLNALKARHIVGAAIDVYDREPTTKDHPYFGLDNIIVTPHLGYVIEENMRVNYGHAVENIRAFLAGNPIRVVKPRS